MLIAEGNDRSFASNVTLAVTLSCVAGIVNAAGFFAVGTYTSHVTGNVSLAGDEFAQGNVDGAVAAAVFVLFFIAGVVTASVFMHAAKRRGKARYAQTLILEAVLLFAFTLTSTFVKAPPYTLQLYLTGILCFAMGMQNALVTRISGAVIRTTHITGIVTDIGIELVAVYYWWRDAALGKTLLERLILFTKLPRNAEMKQLALHLAIFFSFTTGAVGGPLLYLRHDALTMLLPALMIVGLVGFDLLINLYNRRLEAQERALREARRRQETAAIEGGGPERAEPNGVEAVAGEVAAGEGGGSSGEGSLALQQQPAAPEPEIDAAKVEARDELPSPRA